MKRTVLVQLVLIATIALCGVTIYDQLSELVRARLRMTAPIDTFLTN